MFSLGFSEIILILAVALIVLGPEQIPKFTTDLARFIQKLRHTYDDLHRNLIAPLNLPSQISDFAKLTPNLPPDEQFGGKSSHLSTSEKDSSSHTIAPKETEHE